MKARLIRNVIEKHIPKTLFNGRVQNFELQHIEAELSEFERLAEIGRATEKAFKCEGYLAVDDLVDRSDSESSYTMIFESSKELLDWAKED